MGENVFCVARFTAKEGCENDLFEALKALVEPTRKEEGCVSYNLYRALGKTNVLTMIERFKDKEAFDFHSKQPYLSDFQKSSGALIDSVKVDLYTKAV